MPPVRLAVLARHPGPPPSARGGGRVGTDPEPDCPCADPLTACPVRAAKREVTRRVVDVVRERDFNTLTGGRVPEPLPTVIRLLTAALRALDDNTVRCPVRMASAEAYFEEAVRVYRAGGVPGAA